MKKLALVIAVVMLAVCTLACSGQNSETETTEEIKTTPETTESKADIQKLIEDIITIRGNYGQKADAKVDSLLKELEELDESEAGLLRKTIDYWNYLDRDLQINTGDVPEGFPDGDNLCIVVLGYALNKDGSMQDELIGRLTTALDLAEAYPNAYVMCTGGGTAKENPDATEAGRMGEWLLSHGLSEDRLILEAQSKTTVQNAELCIDILRSRYPQVDSCVIVSSSYHIAWGSLLFEAVFLKSAKEADAPEMHVIGNYAYEFENPLYPADQIFRWETGGLLLLYGNIDLANQYFRGTFEKPEL